MPKIIRIEFILRDLIIDLPHWIGVSLGKSFLLASLKPLWQNK
jgi:hypothetical protein